MKFKEGDKVKVRSLEAMKREFGLGEYDEPNTSLEFTPQMERFCGQEVTIAEVHSRFYKIEEDYMSNKWTDEMFEGYSFKYGDIINVSVLEYEEIVEDNEEWREAIYVGYVDGEWYPYIVVAPGDEEAFRKGQKFNTFRYKYAKPISNKVIINGKVFNVSKEIINQILEMINNKEN